MAVPGVSVFGPEGPLFETLRTDVGLQKRVEALAKSAGRGPLFGWKDPVALFKEADDAQGSAGAVPFASHTSFAKLASEPTGQSPFWKTATTAAVPGNLVIGLVAIAGAIHQQWPLQLKNMRGGLDVITEKPKPKPQFPNPAF